MKKNASLLAIATLALFLSCNKLDHWLDFAKNEKVTKALRLDEMQHTARTYQFFYRNNGWLDSIGAHDPLTRYTYVIARHGKRIDSVSMVQDGRLISTNGNIQYDQKGRITAYTYFLREFPEAPPIDYALTYDQQGNTRTISRKNFIGGITLDTLVFDLKNDLVHWDQFIDDVNYTYDIFPNPLNVIDHLFVIVVEEQFLWEYLFSQHNSITRMEEQSGSVTNYENSYDANGRLIKKRIVKTLGPPDSLEFRYAN